MLARVLRGHRTVPCLPPYRYRRSRPPLLIVLWSGLHSVPLRNAHPRTTTVRSSNGRGQQQAPLGSTNLTTLNRRPTIELKFQTRLYQNLFVGSTRQSVRRRLQPLGELHAVPGTATIRADHR